MEGGPISVAGAVTLPAQPAAGETIYVPLGGDGYSSPFAAQSVRNFAVTGDASSGVLEARVNLDPRFVGLVSYMTAQIQQGTSADADVRIDLASTETGMVFQAPVVAVASLINSNEVAVTWRPPATLLPGGGKGSFMRAQVLNVTSDVLVIDVWIYLFDIRVRETTPIAPLLWAQGGST